MGGGKKEGHYYLFRVEGNKFLSLMSEDKKKAKASHWKEKKEEFLLSFAEKKGRDSAIYFSLLCGETRRGRKKKV